MGASLGHEHAGPQASLGCSFSPLRKSRSSLNPLNLDGTLSHAASPWASRIVCDLEASAEAVDGVHSLLENMKGQLLLLFKDGHIREQFLAIDFRAIRASWLSVSIAPPGLSPIATFDAVAPTTEDDDELRICQFPQCGAEFYNDKTFLNHLRHVHNLRNIATL